MKDVIREKANTSKISLQDKEDTQIDRSGTEIEIETEVPFSNSDDEFVKKSRGVLLMSSVKDLIKEEGVRSKAMWIIIISI